MIPEGTPIRIATSSAEKVSTIVGSARSSSAVTTGRSRKYDWPRPARGGRRRSDGARHLTLLLLDPHVVEADALGLLVEALRGVADGPQPEEIAVADHRHLLVELPRLLLPQRHALLGIGLARQLGLELQDVLVGGPARPARRQKHRMGRIVEGADAGRERVVLRSEERRVGKGGCARWWGDQ